MPRGFFEYPGSDGLIDVLQEFGGKWKFERVEELSVEVLAQNLMKTGRLVSSNHRFHLKSTAGDKTATMVISHLLAVAEGRIALVDELCTGVMPDVP